MPAAGGKFLHFLNTSIKFLMIFNQFRPHFRTKNWKFPCIYTWFRVYIRGTYIYTFFSKKPIYTFRVYIGIYIYIWNNIGIYEDGYFETQSCGGKTRFVSLYIKYDCYALRRAFLNRSKVLKSLRLKLFIYHLILVSLVLEHSILYEELRE